MFRYAREKGCVQSRMVYLCCRTLLERRTTMEKTWRVLKKTEKRIYCVVAEGTQTYDDGEFHMFRLNSTF